MGCYSAVHVFLTYHISSNLFPLLISISFWILNARVLFRHKCNDLILLLLLFVFIYNTSKRFGCLWQTLFGIIVCLSTARFLTGMFCCISTLCSMRILSFILIQASIQSQIISTRKKSTSESAY